MAEEVIDNSKQDTVTKDLVGLLPGANGTVEIALEEPASAASESAHRVTVPELEATEQVVENFEQDVVAKNPQEATGDPRPPIYLSYEDSPPVHAKIDGKLTSSPRNARQWKGVLVLFLLAFLLLGLYFRRTGINNPATTSRPALPSTDSVVPKNPLISGNSKQPLDRAGFVLQVGAMKSKDNADALAEALRTEHFPAFLSHQGNDRFYFVIVGPYSDVDSALKAKTDLKKEGFESVRTSWNALAEQPSHSAGSH